MSNYNPGLNMPAAHGSVDISYLQRTSPGPPPPLNLPQVSTPSYPSVALQPSPILSSHPPSPILSSHPPSPLPYPALSAMPQADTTLSIHPRTSATFTFVPTLPEDKNKLDRDASLANDYILNSHIVDDADFARFVVRSDKKQTKVFHSNAAENQSPIVTLEFGRAFSSPQMSIGNGTRIKCKEWVPLWPKDHTRRILQHGGRNYVWYPRGDVNVLEPEDRPGFSIAICARNPPTHELKVEIFSEGLAHDLLETIVTAVVLLESRRHPPLDCERSPSSKILLGHRSRWLHMACRMSRPYAFRHNFGEVTGRGRRAQLSHDQKCQSLFEH